MATAGTTTPFARLGGTFFIGLFSSSPPPAQCSSIAAFCRPECFCEFSNATGLPLCLVPSYVVSCCAGAAGGGGGGGDRLLWTVDLDLAGAALRNPLGFARRAAALAEV